MGANSKSIPLSIRLTAPLLYRGGTQAMPHPRRCFLATCFACTVCAFHASAQTLPSGVINAPSTVIGNNESIGSDTTLNVFEGGSVGSGFQAGLEDGSSTNVYVNIDGGSVGFNFRSYPGSVVNVTGGVIRDGFVPRGVVNISGGSIGYGFAGGSAIQATIEGGVFESGFWAGPTVEVIGGDFMLNGSPFTGSTIWLDEGDHMSGVFADGTPFVFAEESPDFFHGTRDTINGMKLTAATLPPADATPIEFDGTGVEAPRGLRAGQEMTVRAGGELSGVFAAVGATLNFEGGESRSHIKLADATLNLNDGVVDYVDVFSGSEFNIAGGEVEGFDLRAEATVNISGGVFFGSGYVASGGSLNISGGNVVRGVASGYRDYLLVEDGSVDISGGVIDKYFEVVGESTLDISGGTIGSVIVGWGSTTRITGGAIAGIDLFDGRDGSTLEISGGSLEAGIALWDQGDGSSSVEISGGEVGGLAVQDGNKVTILGDEFFVDGMPLELGFGVPTVIGDRDVALSGRLADGSEFEFQLDLHQPGLRNYFSGDATLTLIRVTMPGDFNSDGVVDAADYTVWRDHAGEPDETGLGFNGNGGGVDESDLELWRTNYGLSMVQTGQAVPEPAAMVQLALVSSLSLRSLRRRKN